MPANASSSSTADHPDAGASRWVSVHLYYHGSLDELLRCAVHPLARELAGGGLIEGCFFARYWQGGPHVRFRVRRCEQVVAQLLECVIEARIGQFFAHSPSQALVHPENYLRSARRLGQHEFGHRETAIEPLQPNNSLRFVAYVPEEDRLGGPAGVAAFEPHFMDSTTLALEVIAANPGRQRRTGQALAMMLIAGAVLILYPRPLARFFRFSYRNWGIRNAAGDLDRYARHEAQFEQRYQRQHGQLNDVARRLLDQMRSGTGNHLDETSARWMASVAALRDRLTSQPPTSRQLSVESALFQCLHKHNNRLGITTTEEIYLLFLLQRTLTEIARAQVS